MAAPQSYNDGVRLYTSNVDRVMTPAQRSCPPPHADISLNYRAISQLQADIAAGTSPSDGARSKAATGSDAPPPRAGVRAEQRERAMQEEHARERLKQQRVARDRNFFAAAKQARSSSVASRDTEPTPLTLSTRPTEAFINRVIGRRPELAVRLLNPGATRYGGNPNQSIADASHMLCDERAGRAGTRALQLELERRLIAANAELVRAESDEKTDAFLGATAEYLRAQQLAALNESEKPPLNSSNLPTITQRARDALNASAAAQTLLIDKSGAIQHSTSMLSVSSHKSVRHASRRQQQQTTVPIQARHILRGGRLSPMRPLVETSVTDGSGQSRQDSTFAAAFFRDEDLAFDEDASGAGSSPRDRTGVPVPPWDDHLADFVAKEKTGTTTAAAKASLRAPGSQTPPDTRTDLHHLLKVLRRDGAHRAAPASATMQVLCAVHIYSNAADRSERLREVRPLLEVAATPLARTALTPDPAATASITTLLTPDELRAVEREVQLRAQGRARHAVPRGGGHGRTPDPIKRATAPPAPTPTVDAQLQQRLESTPASSDQRGAAKQSPHNARPTVQSQHTPPRSQRDSTSVKASEAVQLDDLARLSPAADESDGYSDDASVQSMSQAASPSSPCRDAVEKERTDVAPTRAAGATSTVASTRAQVANSAATSAKDAPAANAALTKAAATKDGKDAPAKDVPTKAAAPTEDAPTNANAPTEDADPTNADAPTTDAQDVPTVEAPAKDDAAANAAAKDAAPTKDGPTVDAPAKDAAATEEAPARNDAAAKAAAKDAAPTENAPTKDVPTVGAPAKDAAPTDADAMDAPVEDVPAVDAPAKDAAPAKDIAPTKDAAPTEDVPAVDAPAKVAAPTEEAPAKDAPAKVAAPTEEAPAKDDAPTKAVPTEDAAPTETDAMDAPGKDAPANDAHALDGSIKADAPSPDGARIEQDKTERTALSDHQTHHAHPATEQHSTGGAIALVVTPREEARATQRTDGTRSAPTYDDSTTYSSERATAEDDGVGRRNRAPLTADGSAKEASTVGPFAAVNPNDFEGTSTNGTDDVDDDDDDHADDYGDDDFASDGNHETDHDEHRGVDADDTRIDVPVGVKPSDLESSDTSSSASAASADYDDDDDFDDAAVSPASPVAASTAIAADDVAADDGDAYASQLGALLAAKHQRSKPGTPAPAASASAGDGVTTDGPAPVPVPAAHGSDDLDNADARRSALLGSRPARHRPSAVGGRPTGEADVVHDGAAAGAPSDRGGTGGSRSTAASWFAERGAARGTSDASSAGAGHEDDSEFQAVPVGGYKKKRRSGGVPDFDADGELAPEDRPPPVHRGAPRQTSAGFAQDGEFDAAPPRSRGESSSKASASRSKSTRKKGGDGSSKYDL